MKRRFGVGDREREILRYENEENILERQRERARLLEGNSGQTKISPKKRAQREKKLGPQNQIS